MRLIMLLVMIAGGLLAFGYPAWVDVFSGEEIGAFSLATRDATATGPTVYLDPTDAPVVVAVSVTLSDFAPRPAAGEPEVLYSYSIRRAGARVADGVARFLYAYSSRDQAERPAQPRQEKTVLRIDPVEKGDYDFALARVDTGAMPVREARLVLRRNAAITDERIAPVGYLLLVVGTVGFVLSGRRRKPVPVEPRPPRLHKWGRQ
jgi:hypothetical protein